MLYIQTLALRDQAQLKRNATSKSAPSVSTSGPQGTWPQHPIHISVSVHLPFQLQLRPAALSNAAITDPDCHDVPSHSLHDNAHVASEMYRCTV